jgi:hypothetical protein
MTQARGDLVQNYIDAGRDPRPEVRGFEMDDEIRATILQRRAEREKQSTGRRTNRIGYGALIGTFIVTAATMYSVWNFSGADNSKPVTNADNTAAEPAPSDGLYDLSVLQENDIWRYTELLAKTENLTLGEAMDSIAEANPDINFNKVPEGDSVQVPGLSHAALAGQVGLVTDQPVGDVHTN